ncbi:MAG: glycosyltransferase family 87 protein, partial [Stellaceae bacterium]
FFYPPIYLPVCVVLALLPYLAGYAAWMIATGALFLAVTTRIVGDWRVAVALASFPAAVVNLGLGQNAFLTAALLGLGVLLVDRRPWLAGIALGVLAFKPHFLILVPIALLAGRRWRAVGGMAATVAALTAISLALFGADVWRAFIAHLIEAAAIYGGSAHGYWAETSLYAALRLLGAGTNLAAAVHGAAAMAAAAAVAYFWWRGAGLAERAALLIAGTLVAMPVNLSYDLLAASCAVAFLIPAGLAAGERYAIAALWLLALVGRGVAERWGVPLLPLVALGLLALTLFRLRRESSATESPRPAPGADYRRSRP